jgi:hypothetical protein
VPEWLAETPYDVAYRLAMRDSGDDREYSQVVGLARKEFLLLKAYVAKLRRIPIPKEMPKRLSIAPALEIPFGGNSNPKKSPQCRRQPMFDNRITVYVEGKPRHLGTR